MVPSQLTADGSRSLKASRESSALTSGSAMVGANENLNKKGIKRVSQASKMGATQTHSATKSPESNYYQVGNSRNKLQNKGSSSAISQSRNSYSNSDSMHGVVI